jgi:Family of unknown function (DUF6524)
MDEFRWTGVLWRLAFALALVFVSFNPTGHSYYHWVADGFPGVQPIEAVAGVGLLILWIFFIRSTLMSLGGLGVVLMLALFAAILWWVVSQGWLDPANQGAMSWVVLALLGVSLGVGMSWAHIRRRVSGQASVDRVDT